MSKEAEIIIAYDDHKHYDIAEAERNLMRAIVRTLIDDMSKDGDARKAARNYILSDEDDYVFSFISVCRYLELCPHTIRVILGVQDPGGSSTFYKRALNKETIKTINTNGHRVGSSH